MQRGPGRGGCAPHSRALCGGDRLRLITRGGSDWTKRYPWIVEAALQIRQKRFLQSDEALKLEKPNCIGSTLPCMKNPMPGPPSVYVGSMPTTIS